MSQNYRANGDKNETERIRSDVGKALSSSEIPTLVRVLIAAVTGSIPFLGSALAEFSNARSEKKQNELNELLATWLKLHADEMQEILHTLADVLIRLDYSDPRIEERVKSPEYLSLVRKCFRDWSAAESDEKRKYVRNLLTNAAAPEQLCGDDIIRLFLKWIDDYSEAHFQVIKAVYNNDGITRHEIWMDIHGKMVREDAPEADIFKLLIRDLSMGGIIRQHRLVDLHGNYVRQRKRRRQGPTLKSAFDQVEPYELTGLGNWFVHYTMTEVVLRIADETTVA